MNSLEQKPAVRTAPQHEPGALPAWGLIAGAAAGALIGLFFHRALVGALIVGSLGWAIGAILDRRHR